MSLTASPITLFSNRNAFIQTGTPSDTDITFFALTSRPIKKQLQKGIINITRPLFALRPLVFRPTVAPLMEFVF